MQEQEAPYPTKTEVPDEEDTTSKETNDSEKRKLGLVVPSVTPNPPNPVIKNSAYVNHAEKKRGEQRSS